MIQTSFASQKISPLVKTERNFIPGHRKKDKLGRCWRVRKLLEHSSGPLESSSSAQLEEGFPSKRVTVLLNTFPRSAPVTEQSCYFSSLCHSRKRRSHPNLMQEVYWEGRIQEVASSAMWNGSSQLNWHRVYTGLLSCGVCPG